MAVTSSNKKLIRLFKDNSSNGNKHNGVHGHQRSMKRKDMPWVDVDEDSGKRGPKVNGHRVSGHPGKTARRNKTVNIAASSSSIDGPTNKNPSIQEQRNQLPIAKGKEALIREIREHDVTVLLGETGSGKTTQVPQYILESGIARNGMIAVTQPRKVAATTLATRVAIEQNTLVGGLVGYSVRFDERSGPHTRIKYLTDGMIVRELLSDPLLSRYSVVIVDEAHERTLRTDLLITNLKSIQKVRNSASDFKGKAPASKLNPLKIVIMSATLDAEKFGKFFHHAKILYIKGRQHPVKIYHTAEGQADYVEAAMRTFFQIHTDQGPGDVLIFLPGQEDIERLEKAIHLFAKRLPEGPLGVLICPMFAAQAPGQNAKALARTPDNTRKCILATNIAETSITIPGIKYVIDTGKCKENRYLARNTGGGFETLLTRDITQSSAMQRAGRAGRVGHGFCFRLYTEDAFNAMDISPEPEIRRCSLTSSILQLKCLGQDLEELDFMDKPDEESIVSSLKTLWLLGALTNKRELTQTGREMAAFPLEPIHARSIIASKEYGCTNEILDIISILSASSKLFLDITDNRDDIAEARQKFRHPSGDHLTILNAVRSYREFSANESKSSCRAWCKKHFLNERTFTEAKDIRLQLDQTCQRLKIDYKASCGENEEPILKSLSHGLAQNSAFLQPDLSYKQVMGQSTVNIHPSSVLVNHQSPAIIYEELVYTNHIFARGVSAVPKSFFANITSLNIN